MKHLFKQQKRKSARKVLFNPHFSQVIIYIFRNVKSDCSNGYHVPTGYKTICRQHFVKITLKSENNVGIDEAVCKDDLLIVEIKT